MALLGTLASLSQTAASNAADGSVDAPSTLDQQINSLASYSAQLRDGNGFTTGVGYLGQCRLAKSGSTLLLQRFNGVGLTINGVACTIPAAGVSLAPTSLAPGATYYIYAYMNAGTMTLEPSTTGHSTDTTTGIEIKTGDATRTLVGMARPIAGPAWSDVINQRFVISWFNRRPIQCQAGLGSTVGTTSVPAVELSTGLRCEFLTWANQAADFTFDGYSANSTAFAACYSYMTVDGTLQDAFSAFANSNASQIGPTSARTVAELSEGYHYISPYVSVSAGTGSWVGNVAAGVRCSNKGVILG